MNFKTPRLFSKNIIYLVLILFSVYACQDEVTETNPPNEQETIIQNSSLAILLQNMATLDGSLDNIIDSANCILINLPVDIEINGVAFVIESIEDYEVIEAIFDEFETDEDVVEIMFPITISLNDYTQVVITNYVELEAFIEECSGENEDDDDIECIDFQYPISFSIYDANFQVNETVTINNDEALYNFIENLEGGVLASLNFPVIMILSDGSTLEVNDNQELELAISEAQDDCDEDDDNDWNDDDCTQDSITLALQECVWNIINYNGNSGSIIEKDIQFFEDFQFTVSLNGNVVHEGSWFVTENNGNYELSFETAWDDINGNWTLVDCDEDRLELVNGNNIMVLEQDCIQNENPFECFEGEDFELTECSDSGFGIFNLTEAWADCINLNNFNVSYHESLSDAQQDFNPIAIPQVYSASLNPQTIYIRVELFNNVNEFEVYEIHLNTENCNTSNCTENQIYAYLVECIWNVVNYNGSNELITYNLDFLTDGSLIITGNGQTITSNWSTSVTNDGVWLAFDGVNGPNIQAISGNWLIVECEVGILQMDQNNNTMVIEQLCTTNNSCNVSDVETNLMDCEWTITSYNNDTGFNIFNIDFQTNGQAIIYTPNSTEDYSANWLVSLDGEIYLDLSNISGGNVQVLEGNFILVECAPDQMIFIDPNNATIELVLDKVCD